MKSLSNSSGSISGSEPAPSPARIGPTVLLCPTMTATASSGNASITATTPVTCASAAPPIVSIRRSPSASASGASVSPVRAASLRHASVTPASASIRASRMARARPAAEIASCGSGRRSAWRRAKTIMLGLRSGAASAVATKATFIRRISRASARLMRSSVSRALWTSSLVLSAPSMVRTAGMPLSRNGTWSLFAGLSEVSTASPV